MNTTPTRLQRLQALRDSIVELIAQGVDLPDTLAQIDREIEVERSKNPNQ